MFMALLFMAPARLAHLVESQQQEAHVHAFHNGPEPSHGSTNTHAHETVLCSSTREQHKGAKDRVSARSQF